MTDLDVDLSNRLARLAAAVPVSAGHVDPVHRRAVDVRQRVRLAWITPVVALAAILVGSSLLGAISNQPASTSSAIPTESINEPATATVTDGPFALTIRSPKSIYQDGEAIDIEAELIYTGSDASARISHGLGADAGPMAFGVTEPVPVGDGSLLVRAAYLTTFACVGGQPCPTFPICEPTDLQRDDALVASFEKPPMVSGDPSDGVPDEAQRQAQTAYLNDPELHLPVGTWRPYVIAQFGEGDSSHCTAHDMRAEISIEVVPETAATPGVEDQPVRSVDRDDSFELVFAAAKTRYLPNEPIDISASLTYLGPLASVEVGHDSSGPVAFGIREKVFGEISVGTVSILMFGRTTFAAGEPLVVPFRKGGGFDGDHPDAEKFKAWILDPELRLPAGTWHLYARATGGGGGGAQGSPAFDLKTEITIVVSPDPAATVQEALPTG
jgi:hypothetical protein